ncbi:MAG: heme ABC transporter ATP-binding protein [Ferruginibacter sp.]
MRKEVSMVRLQDVGFEINKKWLVKDLNYAFEPGKMYMLCGPNGAGKSTLLKLISLQQKASEGNIFYNEANVKPGHAASFATNRAVLSQQIDISFPLSAEEIIMMGRYPHFEVKPSKHDVEICEQAIALLELEPFRKRNYLTLSGGEKQRVQFARVLVQIWEEPPIGSRLLLLDEPISSLDIKHQLEFLFHVRNFITPKTIVIAILHDLNLALNYADELLLMKEGRLFKSGKPVDVLQPVYIEQVFGVHSHLHHLPGADFLWAEKL